MDVMTVTKPRMRDYPTIFRSYIVKSTQHILVKIQHAGPILSAYDREQALHTLSYALKLPEAWPDTRALLLTIAPRMEQAGYRDEWLPYLEEGLDQSRLFNDEETAAELQLQLGILYQLRGKYEVAFAQLEASAQGFESLNDIRNQARALNRLAYVARLQRQFEPAIQLAEKAKALLAPEDTECAYSYFVLGLVALDKRDWPNAVHFSKQAFNVWQRKDDQRMMGRSLMCRSVAFEKMKLYEEAAQASEHAIALFEAIQDPFYKAASQMNLGNVYRALDRPLKALELYLPAKQIFQQVQDLYSLAHIHHNMGMAYRQLQQWSKAEEAYQSSIRYQKNLGNVAWLVNALDGLGLVYLEQDKRIEAKKTFEEALSWLTQIEGEPGHQHLLEMITTHLRETNKPNIDP